MPKTLTVQTSKGSRTIPAVWVGKHLAVHHPIAGDGLSSEPCWWAISHVPTGYLAGPVLEAPQRKVIALAKLWDAAFSVITAAGNAHGWRWANRWTDDLSRVQRGRPVIGPRELTPLEALDSAGTYEEVETAVRRAMGYSPAEEPEASEPFPVADTLPADRVRLGDSWPGMPCPPEGWPQVSWRGQWWPAPTVSEMEDYCLGSTAETPDGRTVEPDHPDSWPRLLGLI
jgi:hypothetical protein